VVLEELEEMGGGGGVGCCRGGVWVEKMVVEMVNWKEMGKKKKVDFDGGFEEEGDGGDGGCCCWC